jgi:hypothetical protein
VAAWTLLAVPRTPVGVVSSPALRISEYVPRLVNQGRNRMGVGRSVPVGVILADPNAIGAMNLLGRRSHIDAEQVVVIDWSRVV